MICIGPTCYYTGQWRARIFSPWRDSKPALGACRRVCLWATRFPASAGRLESTTQPDETRMREVCNLGYGRHGCEQFPAGSAADAVRFHVAKDAGELIHIQYVFEKDCWPRRARDDRTASLHQ